jgi:DNA-binding response OmpR family regulator
VKTRVRLLLEVFDRSIDAHISTLRRKRNDDPRDPRSIETIRGAGRRFRNA